MDEQSLTHIVAGVNLYIRALELYRKLMSKKISDGEYKEWLGVRHDIKLDIVDQGFKKLGGVPEDELYNAAYQE